MNFCWDGLNWVEGMFRAGVDFRVGRLEKFKVPSNPFYSLEHPLCGCKESNQRPAAFSGSWSMRAARGGFFFTHLHQPQAREGIRNPFVTSQGWLSPPTPTPPQRVGATDPLFCPLGASEVLGSPRWTRDRPGTPLKPELKPLAVMDGLGAGGRF